ncbi:MAG: hypothetical protein LBM66_05765 [Bifidobacteriaceae bacterium]|jgi:hypothetical protein|nr:hypothetical protein [Bifidobacteriaceae bacterium]
MTAMTKRTFSVPTEVIEEAIPFAHGNLSAYATEALRAQIEQDKLKSLLDQMTAAPDFGPPLTDREIATAERRLFA